MKVGSIPESCGMRIRLCNGICGLSKRWFYRVWYSRWMGRHVKVRQLVVKLWRPFAEMRVSHGMRTVDLGGYREVVSGIALDRLQVWVTWKTFSRRDRRVMREEIARKRVLLVMGYPTSEEIRRHYRDVALGRLTASECEAFESRLVVRA